MQDYEDNTPQEQPEQPPRHVTDPGQMTQPPQYGHSGYYRQPQQPAGNQMEPPVSLGDWMVTILLMCIPLVNIILLFVWAFAGDTRISKANWAKAQLIWTGIAIVINVVIIAAFWGAFAAGISEWGSNF